MSSSSPQPGSEAKTGGSLRRLHLLLRSNWISSTGAATATLALLALATVVALNVWGDWGGPYVGLLTVIILPLVFLGGLLLIPLGLFLYRRRMAERLERLADRPLHLARAVAALTLINFAAVGTLGLTGSSYMNSVQFCGTACHSAMQPEYDTFLDSPHSRVACVACHVGPGAGSYIQSKVNGAKQLYHYVRDTYDRPIPTPVEQLRSARETCEGCHWPEKYLGTKLLVRPHYRDDDAVTQYMNVVLMRTGGKRLDGEVVGIHWHTHPQATVDYVASDASRAKIPWVKVKKPDGSEDVFAAPGVDLANPPPGERRTMDCNDCHNRSAHAFQSPGPALDAAIAAGLLSRRLRGIKRHALEALRFDWTRAEAADGIRRHLQKAYATAGLLDEEHRQLLERASEAIARIWLRNVYPERGVRWDTYADFNSHDGCFRCHDGHHRNAGGKVITQACDACHVVLSEEQEDPTILQSLGLEGR
jgi:hypothetical protein